MDAATRKDDSADLYLRLTQLNEVVVTGTGGAVERRAVGNVIETIKAEDVLAVAPARSVEQLIGQRTPGLIVLPAFGVPDVLGAQAAHADAATSAAIHAQTLEVMRRLISRRSVESWPAG